MDAIPFPYAGITQVRFEGFDLSLSAPLHGTKHILRCEMISRPKANEKGSASQPLGLGIEGSRSE